MNERYELIHGDCIEVMQTLSPCSFDTLICDPPSGISFMGKPWDNHSRYEARTGKGKATLYALTILDLEPWAAGFVAFTVDWAIEALRCLKPGAMGLVWALPRTSDLTGLGLRLAGFEVRENIYHLFGSGFPKSHDISAAIDKAAGVEREIVGAKIYAGGHVQHHSGQAQDNYSGNWTHNKGSATIQETAPATDAARLWQGWGTSLKPAVEEWILVMKPLEGTFAQNALKWNVSGLWVNGCRVEITDDKNGFRKGDYTSNNNSRSSWEHRDNGEAYRKDQHPAGRFPANLLLDQQAAALLDEQSGELTSGKEGLSGFGRKSSIGGNGIYNGGVGLPTHNYGDTGGASRYFTVLPDSEPRMFYSAKASRGEREEGLEDLPEHDKANQYGDGLNSATKVRTDEQAANGVDRGTARNFHPTVKNLSLMRWLVRLTKTPTGGTILDPFVGSGTTIVAALLEGRHCTGIDNSAEYIPIARHRAEHWQDEASTEPRKLRGKASDTADMPLFAEIGDIYHD